MNPGAILDKWYTPMQENLRRAAGDNVCLVKSYQVEEYWGDIREALVSHRNGCDPGVDSKEEVTELFANGNKKAVEKSFEYSKEIDMAFPMPQTLPELTPVVAGGAVCVPVALSGHPMCFNRPVWKENTTEPVMVAMNLSAAAFVGPTELMERGIMVMALARVLSMYRPVRLVAFYHNCGGSGYFSERRTLLMVELGLRPIDWAMAGAVLGHAAALRCLGFFSVIAGNGETGSYDSNMASGITDRKALKAKDYDIVIPRWTENPVPYGKDPKERAVRWIKERLEECIKAMKEGAR